MSHVAAAPTRVAHVNGHARIRSTRDLSPEEVATGWSCQKRDGKVVAFDCDKVRRALSKCFASIKLSQSLPGGMDEQISLMEKLTKAVVNSIAAQNIACPEVEHIQRTVIQHLWGEGLFDAAEHYQNYREEHRKARLTREVTPQVQARFDQMKQHFPTDLQIYQYMSKFARWKENEKRRETWYETVYERVMPWLRQRPGADLTEQEWAEMTASMYAMETSPAMRVVQMAGPALDRCEIGAYNCAVLPIKDQFALPELLYILMQGSGCGFSIESYYTDDLPRVRKQQGGTKETIVVEDDTESWCRSYHRALQLLWDGHDFEPDVTRVRPAGTILKTKGGRASGPGPLLDLFSFTRNVFLSRQGRCLEDTDLHRLACFTGKIVQVGGVRRAATISLSDLSSQGMRSIKSGDWYTNGAGLWGDGKYLTMANNSAVYEETPPVEVFMEEWLALVKSHSGERGIFNRQAVELSKPARRKSARWLCNPCQPGFAPVLTPRGIRTMDDIAIGSTVWTGERWTRVVNKVATGVKPVFRYVTSAGAFVGTACHRVFQDGERIEAGKADRIDVATGGVADSSFVLDAQAVVDGWVIGDGTVHKASNNLVLLCLGKNDGCFHSQFGEFVVRHRPGVGDQLWEVKTSVVATELPRVYSRCVPARFKCGSAQTVRSFLRGLYAANGSVCSNRVTLKATSISLIRDVQEMLSSIGISSYYTCNKASSVQWTNRSYVSRESYDLNITADRERFNQLIGFVHQHKDAKLRDVLASQQRVSSPRKRSYDVIAVEPLGDMPVYDITVEDEAHCYWSGGLLVSNCAEINFPPFSLCNLSIVVARPWDTEESLTRKVRIAAMFGKVQSLCTNFRYVRPDWKRNCEDERLLGVDITGHADCPILRHGAPGRAALLQRLKNVVEEVDIRLSRRWGINRSAANTTVKPSGDSSIFFDCGSGVSARFSQYQIRWVREKKGSPVSKFLIASGVPYAEAPESSELLVFGFPKQAPEGCTLRDHMTAEDQFYNWMEWKENWAEHSVSATIYVEPHEWPSLGALVYKNFHKITGLSFLPKDNGSYRYAPNEELTKEKYDEFASKFPDLNWAKLIEYEDSDQTESAGTFACTGGGCDA